MRRLGQQKRREQEDSDIVLKLDGEAPIDGRQPGELRTRGPGRPREVLKWQQVPRNDCMRARSERRPHVQDDRRKQGDEIGGFDPDNSSTQETQAIVADAVTTERKRIRNNETGNYDKQFDAQISIVARRLEQARLRRICRWSSEPHDTEGCYSAQHLNTFLAPRSGYFPSDRRTLHRCFDGATRCPRHITLFNQALQVIFSYEFYSFQ